MAHRPSRVTTPVDIHLTHLPAAKYQLDIYRVGYRADHAHAVYKDLHSPNQLTRAQVAELKAATSGRAPSSKKPSKSTTAPTTIPSQCAKPTTSSSR